MGWREDTNFGIARIGRLFLGTDNGQLGVEVTATPAELNIMDGVTATKDELNILDGVTSTYAELNYLDLTGGVGVAEDSKALVFNANGKVDFGDIHGGSAAANSLLMGGGTSADPMETALADKSFIEFRTKSTATSGDSRAIYLRHDLNGDGVSGEAIRAFTKLTGTAATARGAHISLDITATKGVTGLGAGIDAQILFGDGVIAGGTMAAMNLELYAAGANVDISGMTESSFLRCVLGGDGTGNDNIEDNAHLLVVTGGSLASGNMVGANTGGDATFANWVPIRIKLNGTVHYLIAAQGIS